MSVRCPPLFLFRPSALSAISVGVKAELPFKVLGDESLHEIPVTYVT